MGECDGKAIPVSTDSLNIGEKFQNDPDANNQEGEVDEQISGNEDLLHDPHLNRPDTSSESFHSIFPATSSERKRRSSNLFDDDSTQKRPKNHTNSYDLHASPHIRKLVEKQERSGSSGKRSRGSFDSEAGFEKRRKVGNGRDYIPLKMLGPLKLPDYAQGFQHDFEFHPEIINLNKQLIEINKQLRTSNCIEVRENGIRKKLSHRRQQIIRELNKKNPLFLPPLEGKPTKISRKLYIPVKQFPDYNFIGLIIGPRGHTQKKMERETGARILLRGRGSTRQRKGNKQLRASKIEAWEDEDLHVYIEAEDEKSLETASEMIEKLLVPVNEEANQHKQAQLKELAEISAETLNNAKPAAKIEHDAHRPATIVSFLDRMMSSESGEQCKLFVGFIPQSVNTERLIELFIPFGRLCEAVVITDRRTRMSKGYGFVKYCDPVSTAKALARMNGIKIDGSVISVRVADRTTPSNVNTIIGPRASRFSHKGRNKWGTDSDSPRPRIPICDGFPFLASEKICGRSRAFQGFSEQCPAAPHLIFRCPFYRYQNDSFNTWD